MPDFTSLTLEFNRGTPAAPAYTALGAAGSDIRFLDLSTGGLTTSGASWPIVTRGSSPLLLSYTYGYTTDVSGLGFQGGGSVPIAYAHTNPLWARWAWDNSGIFGSAPIFTAYNTVAHAPITRGSPAGGLLEGHASDTGATPKSYLKANAWGRVSSAGAPSAANVLPGAPTITDGQVGSVSPTNTATWITSINYQGLMADTDFITAPFTPGVPDTWHIHFLSLRRAEYDPWDLSTHA